MRYLAAILTVAVFSVPVPARAEVTLCPMFSDGAVLQRNAPVPVWGEASPGAKVTIEFAGQKLTAQANGDGTWRASFLPLTVSGTPRTLTVSSAGERVEARNILVGDVWLCAGQSNMQSWVVSSDVRKYLPTAHDPLLRVFLVDVTPTPSPVTQFRQGPLPGMVSIQREKMNVYGQKWTMAEPEAAKWFSAVTYAFGRYLRTAEGVPVGMITASVGGTTAQAWTSRQALLANPALRQLAQEPRAAGLYNGSIAPLAPYALTGVVWYQGESNGDNFHDALQYRTLLPTLIASWRQAWGTALPFILVQLPAYGKIQPQPLDTPWAWVREAQLLASQSMTKTGLTVTIDTGLEDNLHPPTKIAAGERAACSALALVYHRANVSNSPVFRDMAILGSKVRLRFTNAGQGLVSQAVMTNGGAVKVDALPLRGFAICGADHKFVWADAQIVGTDAIEVSSPQIPHPVAVRYAWANFPLCNLYSKNGLPASPFRTDRFDTPTP